MTQVDHARSREGQVARTVDQPCQVDIRVTRDDLLYHVQRRTVSTFEDMRKAGTLNADLIGKGRRGEAKELDHLINTLVDGGYFHRQAGIDSCATLPQM